MAFNDTSSIQDWRQLVEIELTGKTIRYARDAVTFDDGTVYEARLLSMSAMTLSAGQILDPRVTMPSLTLTLDNSDSAISDLLDDYEFGNKRTTVKIGQGTASADYTTVFVGTVLFPSGIEFDDTTVTIDLDDERMKDERVLPVRKFFTSTYANVEEKSRNLPIPFVYGDWRTSAAGGETVPCYCINTSTKTFKIADHAIKQIEAVYKNGVAATVTSSNLTTAEFTISDSYDQLTDVITANIQGATDDATSSGNLLESLPDIVDDILTTHLSVSTSNINASAFTAWTANVGTVKARRHISTEVSSNSLITDALIEGFADLIIEDGKYTPKFRIASLTSLDQYRDYDMMARQDGVKQFKVSRDPERITLNQIVANYNYDPVNLKYKGRFDEEDAAAIALVGSRRRRRMEYKYIYQDADAETRAERELYAFAAELEMVTVGIGPRSLTKKPTDQFRLVYNKYTDADTGFGVPFQVRDIQIDFNQMRAMIRAWNILTLSAGRWTESTAPTWLSSDLVQREEHGFWTDANGYADPSASPDETSKRSKWF
jgi:hypothetical protein